MILLNNRELAGAIWLGIFALWSLRSRDSRKGVTQLLHSFFFYKIQILLFLMLFYIGLLTLGLYQLRIFTTHQLGDLIIWVASVAFLMLMRINSFAERDGALKQILLDTVSVTVIVDFLIHAYVFSIWVELIFVPSMSILGLFYVISEVKHIEYANKLLKRVTGIIILSLIVRSIYLAVHHYKDYTDVNQWREFLFTPLMTTLYLPFLYLIALLIRYEDLFVRVGFIVRDPAMLRYTRYRLFLACAWRLRFVNKMIKNRYEIRFETKRDIQRSIEFSLNNESLD